MTSTQKIKKIVEEIKNESVLVSGGSGDIERYEMRKPELYWKLGIAVNDEAEKNNIPNDQRREWSRKRFKKLDQKIFGRIRKKPLCYLAYIYYNEFQTKEYFMKIADAAGHKFKNLRRKRIDDLISVLSKKNSDITPKKQTKLIEKLCEKDYSRKDFLEIKANFLGKTSETSISWPNFLDAYQDLSNNVFYAMENGKNEREFFRKSIDENSITQIRYLFQLIKMSKDHFKQAYDKAKSILSKKTKAKYPMLTVIETLKMCIKDEKLKSKLFKRVSAYDLSELQTQLHAIQNETNYKEYTERQENIEKMFE